jgi:hypothetical protein
LDRFAKEEPLPMEDPMDITLDEAIERAWKLNFDSKMEFDQYVAMKHDAIAAYKNLTPRLSLGTITNLISLDPLNIISSIGDLAPFLLPNRWLQADEASHRRDAEEDALILMRADIAVQIEATSYLLQRDLAIREIFKTTLIKATRIRELVRLREKYVSDPDGSTLKLDSIMNFISQDSLAVDFAIEDDKSVLAQLMGFHNPHAVRSVSFPEEKAEKAPIDGAEEIDEAQAIHYAQDRAFECRQIDSMIEQARDQKKELDYTWLDPQGDSSLGFGMALPEKVIVFQKTIDRLTTLREQLKTLVGYKVAASLKQRRTALRIYEEARKGILLNEELLAHDEAKAKNGKKVDQVEVASTLQDLMTNLIRAENAKADYRTARSKLDRLLLENYYSWVGELPKTH